jgi:hypothetical protein
MILRPDSKLLISFRHYHLDSGLEFGNRMEIIFGWSFHLHPDLWQCGGPLCGRLERARRADLAYLQAVRASLECPMPRWGQRHEWSSGTLRTHVSESRHGASFSMSALAISHKPRQRFGHLTLVRRIQKLIGSVNTVALKGLSRRDG